MKEIIIRYKPTNQLSETTEVILMGNFNGYLPTLMERYTEEEVKN